MAPRSYELRSFSLSSLTTSLTDNKLIWFIRPVYYPAPFKVGFDYILSFIISTCEILEKPTQRLVDELHTYNFYEQVFFYL